MIAMLSQPIRRQAGLASGEGHAVKSAVLLAFLSACSAEGDGARHLGCSTSSSRVKQLPCHDSSPGKLYGGLAQQYLASLCTVVGIAANLSGPALSHPASITMSPGSFRVHLHRACSHISGAPFVQSGNLYDSASEQEHQAGRMHMLDLQDLNHWEASDQS